MLLLQLADRLASSQRAEGGSSSAFIPPLDYNYLRLVEAYLLHDLRFHFTEFGDDYAAFSRFVRNCWWLEVVKASASDSYNSSLRTHLLLTDSIYQIYLKAVDKFGFELKGRKAKEFLRYRLSRIKIPSIEGRPKDLSLRIMILQLLEDGERRAYQIWKVLMKKGVSKDKRFVCRVLEELETINMLNRDDDKRYSLKKSLATKRSFVEARYCTPSDEKMKSAIRMMHAAGFELEGIAFQTGLPKLHVKAVLDKTINRRTRKK